jgi:hypothetical protein
MRILLALVVVLPLAGCQTDQERMAEYKERKDALDDQTCRNYGAKPGTDIYIQCRMSEAQRRATAESTPRPSDREQQRQHRTAAPALPDAPAYEYSRASMHVARSWLLKPTRGQVSAGCPAASYRADINAMASTTSHPVMTSAATAPAVILTFSFVV